jgi:hypothetical protein
MTGEPCSCVEIDSSDITAPAFCRERVVQRARVGHLCAECDRAIEPGESYLYVSGRWEDYFGALKICQDCQSIIQEFFSCGYHLGRVRASLRGHVYETDGRIPEACILALTPRARDWLLDVIDRYFIEADRDRVR